MGHYLFYCRNYSNLAKIFILMLFKMIANQTQGFGLEQRSVIKFLVVEKYKSCKIYFKKTCDMYGEACFSKKKKLYKWAKHVFAIISLTVHGRKRYWLSSKEKVSAARVSKEDRANILFGHERIYHYWFA